MKQILAFLKKWLLDGWITTGDQVACPPGLIKCFAVCYDCKRVFPHWNATMTAAEAKARGFLGCKCGGMRLHPFTLPAWKSVWWFVVRGWLVRGVIQRKRVWDPRMPILEKDLS